NAKLGQFFPILQKPPASGCVGGSGNDVLAVGGEANITNRRAVAEQRLDHLLGFEIEVQDRAVAQTGQSEATVGRNIQGLNLVGSGGDLVQFSTTCEVPSAHATVTLRPATGGNQPPIGGKLDVVYRTRMSMKPADRRGNPVCRRCLRGGFRLIWRQI